MTDQQCLSLLDSSNFNNASYQQCMEQLNISDVGASANILAIYFVLAIALVLTKVMEILYE